MRRAARGRGRGQRGRGGGAGRGRVAASEPVAVNALVALASAPSKVWVISEDSKQMAQAHEELMTWINEQLNAFSDPFSVKVNDEIHTRPLTANSMRFFKVIMCNPAEENVTLAFSLEGMYLLGFSYGNHWYFYDDARLHGLKSSPEWSYLGYAGRYVDSWFETVSVSQSNLVSAHGSIFHYPNRGRNEVKKALFLIAVVVSEAKRFSECFTWIQEVFDSEDSRILGESFEKLFRCWSAISKKVIKTPDEFQKVLHYSTYNDALSALSVIHRVKEGQA